MYYTWKSLFGYLFNTALCNIAKIWDVCGYYNRQKRMGLYNVFRRELAIKLMARNRAHLHIFTYGSVLGKRTVLATVLKPSGSHSG